MGERPEREAPGEKAAGPITTKEIRAAGPGAKISPPSDLRTDDYLVRLPGEKRPQLINSPARLEEVRHEFMERTQKTMALPKVAAETGPVPAGGELLPAGWHAHKGGWTADTALAALKENIYRTAQTALPERQGWIERQADDLALSEAHRSEGQRRAESLGRRLGGWGIFGKCGHASF